MKTSSHSSYSDFKDHVIMILRVLVKCDVDEFSDVDTILTRIDSNELSQILSKVFHVRIIPDEIHSCSRLQDLINILFLKILLPALLPSMALAVINKRYRLHGTASSNTFLNYRHYHVFTLIIVKTSKVTACLTHVRNTGNAA